VLITTSWLRSVIHYGKIGSGIGFPPRNTVFPPSIIILQTLRMNSSIILGRDTELCQSHASTRYTVVSPDSNRLIHYWKTQENYVIQLSSIHRIFRTLFKDHLHLYRNTHLRVRNLNNQKPQHGKNAQSILIRQCYGYLHVGN